MPDLADDAVETFWRDLGPDFQQVVSAEERMEDWPIDRAGDTAVIGAIVALGKAFDAPAMSVRKVLRNPALAADLRLILAYMRASRRLRLIGHLINTDRADALLLRELFDGDGSEVGDAAANALRNSVIILERKRLLNDLFDPDRLDLIIHALLEYYE
jgi:hypothetical protein